MDHISMPRYRTVLVVMMTFYTITSIKASETGMELRKDHGRIRGSNTVDERQGDAASGASALPAHRQLKIRANVMTHKGPLLRQRGHLNTQPGPTGGQGRPVHHVTTVAAPWKGGPSLWTTTTEKPVYTKPTTIASPTSANGAPASLSTAEGSAPGATTTSRPGVPSTATARTATATAGVTPSTATQSVPATSSAAAATTPTAGSTATTKPTAAITPASCPATCTNNCASNYYQPCSEPAGTGTCCQTGMVCSYSGSHDTRCFRS